MNFDAAQNEIFLYTDLLTGNTEKEIAIAYRSAFKEIDKKLKNLYLKIQDQGIPKEEIYNYLSQYNRLKNLRESIVIEYNNAFQSSKNSTLSNSTRVMTEQFYRETYLLNWGLDIPPFTVLDARVIDAAATGRIQTWGDLAKVYGPQTGYIPQAGTLAATLKANNIKNLTDISRALNQALITGESYTKTAKKMRDLFNGIASNSMRVARTEGTRTMNAGNYANVWHARSEGVDIVRHWLATLDAVTRRTHQIADNKPEDKNGIFHVGNATGNYPGNMSTAGESINCRCSVRNQVPNFSPKTRRGKDPLTGESDLISFKTFDEWMDSKGMKLTKSGWIKV